MTSSSNNRHQSLNEELKNRASIVHPTKAKTYFFTGEEQVVWEELRKCTEKILSEKSFKIIIPNFVVRFDAFFNEIFSCYGKKTLGSTFDKVFEDFDCRPHYSIKEDVGLIC